MSGGGGWGLKQGLLSLDPETSYTQPEQEDIEMFIKAFQERGSSNPSEGLVTPGSYILFCIEPQLTTEDIWSQGKRKSSTMSLGVAPTTDEGVALNEATKDVVIHENHFGVATTAGLFLRTIPEANGNSAAEGSKTTSQAFTTKISVPRACLSLGVARQRRIMMSK